MPRSKNNLRALLPYASLALLMLTAALCAVTISRAAEPPRGRDGLREPVYRTAKKIDAAPENQQPAAAGEQAHPLDPALELAREGLHHIRAHVNDYTCTLIKRERVDGVLGEPEFILTKVRNRKVANGQIVSPFSVYMYFAKPANVRGREVVYVENRNGGKLMAHEGGLQGRFLPTVSLDPTSGLAMRGQRYPITEVGIENLVAQLISRGERDRKRGECEVQFFKDAKINGRTCTMLKVIHPVPREYFDFHIAEVFIDDEYRVPIRYAAYSWPTSPGATPELIEEYTYLNLKLNVGLTDRDFDSENPDYNF